MESEPSEVNERLKNAKACEEPEAVEAKVPAIIDEESIAGGSGQEVELTDDTNHSTHASKSPDASISACTTEVQVKAEFEDSAPEFIEAPETGDEQGGFCKMESGKNVLLEDPKVDQDSEAEGASNGNVPELGRFDNSEHYSRSAQATGSSRELPKHGTKDLVVKRREISLKPQQFSHGQLKVYNCWRERGLNHQEAWAKVQLLKHLTEGCQVDAQHENLDGAEYNAPGFKSQLLMDHGTKGLRNKHLPPGKIPKTPAGLSAGTHFASPAAESPVRSTQPLANLPVRTQRNGSSLTESSQDTSSTLINSPILSATSSAAALAGILFNGVSCDFLVPSYLTKAQHLLAVPSVAALAPTPKPAPSNHLKRHHAFEERGVHKKSKPDDRPQTSQVQIKRKPATPEDPLHVCVVPTGYPMERLTDEQMDAIENSILEAILEIDDESVKPAFIGTFRKKGRLELLCQNLNAKTWLDKYSGYMYEPWPGASLKIIPAEPESHIVASALLPPCKNDDNDRILRFIAKQNAQLHVDLWEVVQRSDGGDNTSLTLRIDEESAKILKSKRKINFKMGAAYIELIEDSNEEFRESFDATGETRTSTDESGKFRDLGVVTSRGKLRSCSSGSQQSKHPQRFSSENSTTILNSANESNRMKVTVDIEVRGKIDDGGARPGASRGSGTNSSHRVVQAGKRDSSRICPGSHHKRRDMIHQGEHHHGLGSSRTGSLGLGTKTPSRQDQPCGSNLSSRYGGLDGSWESFDSGKPSNYIDFAQSPYSSWSRNYELGYKASRSPSPGCSLKMKLQGAPDQRVDQPTYRRRSPGERFSYHEHYQHYQLQPSNGRSCEYSSSHRSFCSEHSGSFQSNRSVSSGRSPLNDHFQGRLALEKNTEEIFGHRRHRWPLSDDSEDSPFIWSDPPHPSASKTRKHMEENDYHLDLPSLPRPEQKQPPPLTVTPPRSSRFTQWE